MAKATKQCYNGRCYYVYTDAWHVWGRWLLLALLIALIIFMIPFSGYLMSLKRMRNGLSPVPGCGWMFPNPYKNAQAPSDVETQSTERPPRYRPHNMYLQYQQQQQRERIQREQEGYSSTDGEIGDSTTNYSEMTEKPVPPSYNK